MDGGQTADTFHAAKCPRRPLPEDSVSTEASTSGPPLARGARGRWRFSGREAAAQDGASTLRLQAIRAWRKIKRDCFAVKYLFLIFATVFQTFARRLAACGTAV